MAKYQFSQSCHPRGDLRVNDLTEFLKLMQEAFGVRGWIDADGNLVDLRPEAVERLLLAQNRGRDLAKFGAGLVVVSVEEHLSILLKIAVGGDEWAPNDFSVDFSHTDILPNLRYFRQSIELIRPYEASIFEQSNFDALLDKHQQQPRMPPGMEPYRPWALDWFHYLDAELVDRVGGWEQCLNTPAYKVERFCDGVLFQLTAEPFDPDNPQHTEAQRQAMEHLALE